MSRSQRLDSETRYRLIRCVLCVWLPNWAIQRTEQIEPGLKDQALVLELSNARGKNVAACSAKAARSGIRPGMPVAEAKALATTPLAVREYAPDLDQQALVTLAEQCERFSPTVAIEDGAIEDGALEGGGVESSRLERSAYPESLLLDITGVAHLFGSPQDLAERVEHFFVQRGLSVRIAGADSIGLAWAVAHFGHWIKPRLSLPALVSSSDQSLLSSLPVAALRLPREIAQLLEDLGIERVDQLLSLPRESLLARFGPQLAMRLDQLTGVAEEVMSSCKPSLPFKVEEVLEAAIKEHFLVVAVLRRLLRALSKRLQADNLGVVTLLCKLTCRNRQIVKIPLSLFQPATNPDRIMELLELHLEQLQLPDEIVVIAIEASTTGALVREQRELFSREPVVDSHQLSLLINRLSSRLGNAQVSFPRFRSSSSPEQVRQYVPAAKAQRHRGCFQGKPARDRLRPLMLWKRPVAIEITLVHSDDVPSGVWIAGDHQAIKQAWGPERIETGWWRGRSVLRDYYRVETEVGSRWWVFRRHGDGQWFLHGEFV